MSDTSEYEHTLRLVLPYFRRLGYQIFRQEQPFGVGARRARVDLVFYTKDSVPFVVVEVKFDEELNNIDIYHPLVQQALNYALIAETPYFVITNCVQFFWYQVDYTTGVPKLSEPISNPSASQNEVALFHSTEEVERVFFALANIFRGYGGLPSSKAVTEIIRLLQAKAIDEQRVASGMSSEFHVQLGESDEQVGQRVEKLLQGLIDHSEIRSSVPASFVVSAVSSLQSYSLLQSDKRYTKPALDRLISSMFKKELGQYITPYPILEFLVKALNPQPSETVLDPFCGTGGFLSQVLTTWHADGVEYERYQQVYGIDKVPSIAQIARLNMIISGGQEDNILVANSLDMAILDSLGIKPGKFDVIISNPPLGLTIKEFNYISQYEMGRNRQQVRIEYLFIELFLRTLTLGGRAGFVISDSVLTSNSFRSLRKWLLTHASVDAVISLPLGIWEATGVKTSILLISKQNSNPRHPIFLGNVRSISPSKSRGSSIEDELSLIAQYYRQFLKDYSTPGNDTAWSVPFTEQLIERLDVAAMMPSYTRSVEQLRHLSLPVVRLSEICEEIFRGLRFKSSDSGIKVIGIGEIRNGSIAKSSSRFVDAAFYEGHRRHLELLKDDIVISATGQIGLVAVVYTKDIPAAASDSIIVVRPQQDIISSYILAILLTTSFMQDQLRQISIGSALPQITVDALGKILIPLPDQRMQYMLNSQIEQLHRLREEAYQVEQSIFKILSIDSEDETNV